MFAVETGIPVPVKTRRGKEEKYPFSQLDVNQSFFVPAGENVNITKTVIHAAYSAEKRIQKKTTETRRFTVRSVVDEDGAVTGTRVWRTQ